MNVREKLKWQSIMDITETLATLDTQDTKRRQTQGEKTKQTSKQTNKAKTKTTKQKTKKMSNKDPTKKTEGTRCSRKASSSCFL